jgi:hypothetical protein
MLRSFDQLDLEMGEILTAPKLSSFARAVSSRDCSKRLSITRRGYIEMCPAAAQPRDRVALLWNASGRMSLRPLDDFYRIVGGSYIAALTEPKVDGISHPLEDLILENLEPGMTRIR